MPIGLYMDVNISKEIADQLQRRGVDVLRAQEDHAGTLPDPDLLERASRLGRILFTHDIRFRVLAEDWQRQGCPFVGLVFGHPLRATIGQFVADLELIALASEPAEWISRVDYLPY